MRLPLPLSLLTVGCIVAGCASGQAPSSGDGTGGVLSEGSGGRDQEDEGSGGSPPLDPPPPTEECLIHCSSDLKSVVDCHGVVTDECTDGSACLDGVCTAGACEVAHASQSSVGCDYWAVKPDLSVVSSRVGCFAVIVANTWNTPLHVDVRWQDQALDDQPFIYLPRGQGAGLTYEPYDPDVGVPAGDMAILFVADYVEPDSIYVGCPMPPYFREEVGVWDTGRGEGFHLRTTAPAAVYSSVPYGGGEVATSSVSLLFPTGHWDREYIAVNAYAKSELVEQGLPSLDILASEDDTTVDILPKVAIVGAADVDPSAAGEPVTYHLSQGEYLQLSQVEELTGSLIVADKPIAVWGGTSCMNIPVATPTGDAAHQQLPPVRALGHEYVGVRYGNRSTAGDQEEETPWRLVGAVDGTVLDWEPAPPIGAPDMLDQGDWVEFWGAGPFVVRSQDEEHPFYVAQYMTSGTHVAEGAREGDPEWVNVVAPEQYLKEYVFFTDPTYPETSVVVTRARNGDGAFADVVLECAGVLGGWQPIGEFEYTRARLVQGNFENVGSCSNGVQRMRSDGAFGVTVWGWGASQTEPSSSLGSYAFPAGVGLRAVNETRLPPPVVR